MVDLDGGLGDDFGDMGVASWDGRGANRRWAVAPLWRGVAPKRLTGGAEKAEWWRKGQQRLSKD